MKVAPRKGRVSRNDEITLLQVAGNGRAPQGACE